MGSLFDVLGKIGKYRARRTAAVRFSVQFIMARGTFQGRRPQLRRICCQWNESEKTFMLFWKLRQRKGVRPIERVLYFMSEPFRDGFALNITCGAFLASPAVLNVIFLQVGSTVKEYKDKR